ncbi:stanniocalcin-2-like [Mobula hypostoma]|uniref:stanniocalcin-2-like n=1 Tax=Mobula hypostoma TaxID=723540 RepID=UPI002FC3E075
MDARVLLLLFTTRCLLIAVGADNMSDFLGQNGCSATAVPGEGRLDQQSAGEISACLRSAPDVGCDVFQCLVNTTCHLEDNLYEICRDFLQNSDNFDVQGKRFIRNFLKCSIIGLRSRFSSGVGRCAEVQRILIHVQGWCYHENNICDVAATNIDALVDMVDFNKLQANGAYLEFVKFLFDCGNSITEPIRSRLQSILDVLKQLLEDSCIIVEKVTTITVSEENGQPDENVTHELWK